MHSTEPKPYIMMLDRLSKDTYQDAIPVDLAALAELEQTDCYFLARVGAYEAPISAATDRTTYFIPTDRFMDALDVKSRADPHKAAALFDAVFKGSLGRMPGHFTTYENFNGHMTHANESVRSATHEWAETRIAHTRILHEAIARGVRLEESEFAYEAATILSEEGLFDLARGRSNEVALSALQQELSSATEGLYSRDAKVTQLGHATVYQYLNAA